MKIALCGRPCSGKSAVGKILAEELHLKHYSAGDYMRRLALEQGTTIEEFTKSRAKKWDYEVDSWMENIGKTQENFIFDGHLAFYFLPDAIKIFLDVTYEQGAQRIFLKQRSSESKSQTVKELAKKIQQRWEDERKLYKSLYNLDIDDKKNYTLYIDTTGLSIDQVIQEIKRVIPTL